MNANEIVKALRECAKPVANCMMCPNRKVYDCSRVHRIAAADLIEELTAENARLEAICAAERDGRCVVLPCKAGDTVYAHRHSPASGKKVVIEARCAATKVHRVGFTIDVAFGNGGFAHLDWGNQVWLTRAEAEAALTRKLDGGGQDARKGDSDER